MTITFRSAKNAVLGTAEIVDGALVTTGKAGAYLEGLTVLSLDQPRRRLTPADGDAYLEAARHEFRSGYVRAIRT